VGLPIVFFVILLFFFQYTLVLFFEPCEPFLQVFDRGLDLLEARFAVSGERCDPVIEVALQPADAARDARDRRVVLERQREGDLPIGERFLLNRSYGDSEFKVARLSGVCARG